MKKHCLFPRVICLLIACILLMGSCSSIPVSTNDGQQTSNPTSSSPTTADPHMTNVLFQPGELTQPFDYEQHHYTVDVPTEYDYVNIVPILDSGLTVDIENPEKLEYGKNEAKIHVINEAQEKTTYFFILNRIASDNADLASLSLDGFDLDKAFDKAVFEYKATVKSDTTSVKVSLTLDDETAAYEITGNDNLKYGENLITIKVTSQSKAITNEYRINVTKPEPVPEGSDIVADDSKKYIAITFDDGPSPYTDELLDILKKHDVKATFYLVGNRVAYYPDEVQRMVNEGHALGNHTWDHTYLKKLSDEKKLELIEKTDDAVYELTGQKTTTIRPPGGKWDRSIKTFADKPVVFWSVDPEDWKYRDTDVVVKNIMNYTKKGSIILLHDLYPTSVKAADIVIGRLKEKGYTFVTVDELREIY